MQLAPTLILTLILALVLALACTLTLALTLTLTLTLTRTPTLTPAPTPPLHQVQRAVQSFSTMQLSGVFAGEDTARARTVSQAREASKG